MRYPPERGLPRPDSSARIRGFGISILIVIVIALFFIRSGAGWFIDYQWWEQMGQLTTYWSMLAYSVIPGAIATVIGFIVFWIAHARGLKHAGTALREHPLYAKLTTLAAFVLALLVAAATTDTWAVVRYFGGRDLGGAWHDPVFGEPLAFYLFRLPFYHVLLRFVLAIVIIAAIIYWAVARAWHIRRNLPRWDGTVVQLDLRLFGAGGAFELRFVRVIVAAFLVALAVWFFLARYELMLTDHGFMVGIDWVNENVSLPLQWVAFAGCLIAAAGVAIGRPALLIVAAAAIAIRIIVPPIVSSVYVKPSEISIEKPYIARHIEATRTAYALDQNIKELSFPAVPQEPINVAANRPVLDNVRLWDWTAFRETVAQIQPLRPYVYENPDVDRYTIDGKLRQVLVVARELDLSLLGEAGSTWVNSHILYTHGYGIVMAEANRITTSGLPVLLIKDAPPVVTAPDLKVSRPELYYGEAVHEPVYVHTSQPEFNYPSGSDNVYNTYAGNGGIAIHPFSNRFAAALSRGDLNTLLTSYFTPESRMQIRRSIVDRLNTLASFIAWDFDPYIVLTKDGRLVWIVDGYMTSDAHPYSQMTNIEGIGQINYIRNSVKATVDAYDGTVHMYVFDPADPLLAAYRNLFPKLFEPWSAIPPDIRAHTRYPELIFRVQADLYRLFHMRDPETFYNKSDAWDLAQFTTGPNGSVQPAAPNYVIASIPGSTQPEFVEMIPFTPRNRLNLIGLMIARCDGQHLGERVVLELNKKEIVPGPLQIESRIHQDQVISKDLTLWNQQGSQVLRGQMVILPIQNTFLYISPIYLKSAQASMPQLKKVVIAMGDTLIYSDTYEQAVAQLAGAAAQTPGTIVPPSMEEQPTTTTSAAPTTAPAAPQPATTDPRIAEIRQHLDRYKQLVAQGKWAEAGKELEAVQALVRK